MLRIIFPNCTSECENPVRTLAQLSCEVEETCFPELPYSDFSVSNVEEAWRNFYPHHAFPEKVRWKLVPFGREESRLQGASANLATLLAVAHNTLHCVQNERSIIWATGEIKTYQGNSNLAWVGCIQEKLEFFRDFLEQKQLQQRGMFFLPYGCKKNVDDDFLKNFIEYDFHPSLSVSPSDEFVVVWIKEDQLGELLYWFTGVLPQESKGILSTLHRFLDSMNSLEEKCNFPPLTPTNPLMKEIARSGVRLARYMEHIQGLEVAKFHYINEIDAPISSSSISHEHVPVLQLAQRDFFALVLEQAFDPSISTYWTCNYTELQSIEPQTRFQALIHRILQTTANFRKNTENFSDLGFVFVESSLNKLLTISKHINHYTETKEITLSQAIFVEYILGLGFFECLVVMGKSLVDDSELNQRRRKNVHSFWRMGLMESFDFHHKVLLSINSHFSSQPRSSVWQVINEKWNSLNSSVRSKINETVSMRNAGDTASTRITLTQIYHWDGWGGINQIIDFLKERPEHPMSFLREENQHKHHFDWHTLQDKESKDGSAFNKRQKYFMEEAVPLLQWARLCTSGLLRHKDLLSIGEGNYFRIWGDAVGPKAISEEIITRGFLDYSRDTFATPKKKIHMVLTDVSAISLNDLVRLPPTSTITRNNLTLNVEILYRDLNLPFPGEPGFSASRLLENAKPNTFDCYSCSVALHQIADTETRHERIRGILSFATKIVRPGGIISIPDVGAGVAQQVYLLPINLVDREGGWEGDVFSIQSNGKRIASFLETACLEDGESIKNKEIQDEILCKTPVPLLELWRGTPFETFCQTQKPVYNFIPYLIIKISFSKLQKLDEKWVTLNNDWKCKIELIEEMVRFWRADISISKISRDISAFIKDTFHQQMQQLVATAQIVDTPHFLKRDAPT